MSQASKPKSFAGDLDNAAVTPLHVIAARDIRPAKDIARRAELVYLPLSSLVVEQGYQRPITSAGVRNILRIVETFDWRKFAPVIVRRLSGGKYGIIDGQHRSTAALMHPDVHEVPCMVIDASFEDAAACFAAINGTATAMTLGHMWHARVASGEAYACAIADVLTECGVKILRMKFDGNYEPGETFAIGTIEAIFKRQGAAVLRTALRMIVGATCENNAGELRGPTIAACAAIANARMAADVSPHRLIALAERVDFAAARVQAISNAAQDKITTTAALLAIINVTLDDIAGEDTTAPRELADA